MPAYEALAASYDRLTNDVDYEATVAFYHRILAKEGLRPRTAVDLACGTGSVALILARMGYRVTGVDMSEEMLTVASQRAQDMDNPPRFIHQKLQRLYLPRAWTWQCARWTAWTISWTRRTAGKRCAGCISA